MAWSLRRVSSVLSCLGLSVCSGLASAQEPAGAAFPAEPEPPPPAAPSGAAPAATPEPPPPQPAPAPAGASAPATAAPPPAPPRQPYEAQGPEPEPDFDGPYAQPGYGSAYGEPPPPPAPPPRESKIPPFSIRLDPFNWILEGRLGLELEVGLLSWLTIESIPMFVTDGTPPFMNYSSYEVNLSQHSGGLGPLAGATLGVNFWLSGKAFRGYAIRAGITNYSLEYESKTEAGARVDFVQHTERQLFALFGSVNRWGAFTIAGGIGLGYELNQETRCYSSMATDVSQATSGDCDEIQLATRDPVNLGPIARVTPFTYPWEILARFSLGVTID